MSKATSSNGAVRRFRIYIYIFPNLVGAQSSSLRSATDFLLLLLFLVKTVATTILETHDIAMVNYFEEFKKYTYILQYEYIRVVLLKIITVACSNQL